jgi:hypothetical protein
LQAVASILAFPSVLVFVVHPPRIVNRASKFVRRCSANYSHKHDSQVSVDDDEGDDKRPAARNATERYSQRQCARV